jgi:predicted phosphodiesterase
VKLRIASDLHLNHHADFGRSFLDIVSKGDFDMLVVAGDIADGPFFHRALTDLCNAMAGRQVIYVKGNHDYYSAPDAHDSYQYLPGYLEQKCGASNLSVLDVDYPLTFNGQRFVGCTLWFGYPADPLSLPWGGEELMGDFRWIANIQKWVGAMNAKHDRYLSRTVGAGDIVVTHHLPHPGSVAPRFSGSVLNRYFLYEMTCLIERAHPKLWIHGHTHDACDYVADRTRVVCNPLGYPSEWARFKILDIDTEENVEPEE